MYQRAFIRSARMPLKKRENPYITPLSVRKMPRLVFEMPRSASRPGMASEKFLRTK